jgi:hypothetical protein
MHFGPKPDDTVGKTVALDDCVMTITKGFTPLALAAALTFAAAPAFAEQHHGGGNRGGGGGGGRTHDGGGSRSGGGAVARGPVNRGGGPAVSRGVARPRAYSTYRGGVRGVSPRVYYGGARFYRPYYSFRPRVSLGLGLWLGYPVTYPYYYGYGYPYPVDPYAYGYAAPSYGYPAQPYNSASPAYDSSDPDDDRDQPAYPPQQSGSSVGVQPGQQSAPGGVSFEITPDTAAVFVDGTYVGTAANFGPTSQPLGLISGRHHIEIRASGYRTMTFDADITAGQVLPYQGTLQPN